MHPIRLNLLTPLLLACSLLPMWSTAQEQKLSDIQLTQGFSITGSILREKADSLILDLGFTILPIPKDYIISIEESVQGSSELIETDHLYRVTEGADIQSVKDLVHSIGEAVVLIRTNMGLGSGFIIDPRGYIVTNNHVIAGEHEIQVTVFEQSAAELTKRPFQNVRIVATDASRDLALLKVDHGDDYTFKTAPIGESDQLESGQRVFAVGSPLGLERSVSQGIISLKNRLIEGNLYIQQTSEISPGNSGGPLFNTKGEVIGVNNMKVVATGAEGLGFAIPANTLKMFLHNREAFAFDPQNPNAGFLYHSPPTAREPEANTTEAP